MRCNTPYKPRNHHLRSQPSGRIPWLRERGKHYRLHKSTHAMVDTAIMLHITNGT